MSHLSSCYFCGTALDDPLREYAVVPAGHPGADATRTTLTLCPGCRRKLATVFESADATEGDGPSLAAVSGTSLEVAADAGDDESAPAESAETSDTAETASDETVEDDDTDTTDITADDVAAMAGDLDTRILDAGDDTDETPDTDDADADSEESGDSEPTGGEQADSAESMDSAETAATEPAEPVPDSDTEEDDAPEAAETTVSALEYNKVMRLLQNRQFPVDRAEIETVAANAYDLTREECAAVIDLAVDRGLIEASGDQLIRPD